MRVSTPPSPPQSISGVCGTTRCAINTVQFIASSLCRDVIDNLAGRDAFALLVFWFVAMI